MTTLETIELKQEHAAVLILVFVAFSVYMVYASIVGSKETSQMPYNLEQMYNIDYERINIQAVFLVFLLAVVAVPGLFMGIYFTHQNHKIFCNV